MLKCFLKKLFGKSGKRVILCGKETSRLLKIMENCKQEGFETEFVELSDEAVEIRPGSWLFTLNCKDFLQERERERRKIISIIESGADFVIVNSSRRNYNFLWQQLFPKTPVIPLFSDMEEENRR